MNSRILPLLALFAALVIFFAYVNPTWTGSIAATRATISAHNRALAAAESYASQQNELATKRDLIDPSMLDRVETFLPDSVDNVGMILDLNSLAARSGLTLSGIDVATDVNTPRTAPGGALPVRSQQSISSVDLSLSAIGTYAALQSFLSSIEKSARLADVRDITVRGSNTGVYTYQMVIRLYWLR